MRRFVSWNLLAMWLEIGGAGERHGTEGGVGDDAAANLRKDILTCKCVARQERRGRTEGSGGSGGTDESRDRDGAAEQAKGGAGDDHGSIEHRFDNKETTHFG